jgi:hypothetical protein
MYKKADRQQLSIEEFYLPFGGQLSADNRWGKLARLMPWDLVEDIYAEKFKNDTDDGNVPIPARVAFGSLHIKAEEAFTDERTLLFIMENPYDTPRGFSRSACWSRISPCPRCNR